MTAITEVVRAFGFVAGLLVFASAFPHGIFMGVVANENVWRAPKHWRLARAPARARVEPLTFFASGYFSRAVARKLLRRIRDEQFEAPVGKKSALLLQPYGLVSLLKPRQSVVANPAALNH